MSCNSSYSWSANICGLKKWIIFPPGQERFLRDNLGNLPYDITSAEMNDQAKYPEFSNAPQPITVIQGEGEVIFVPRFGRKLLVLIHSTHHENLCVVIAHFPQHVPSQFFLRKICVVYLEVIAVYNLLLMHCTLTQSLLTNH